MGQRREAGMGRGYWIAVGVFALTGAVALWLAALVLVVSQLKLGIPL